MNSESGSRSGLDSVTAAHEILDDLMARVGVDGLAAALALPGLLATVDQHAASVRQAIARSRRPVDATALAAYARSVIAVVQRSGRRLPAPGEADYPTLDWSRAPWHLVRLVAVCALADAAGCL